MSSTSQKKTHFLIYSHTSNVTSVSMERIYISQRVSSFQMVREMKAIGDHGVNLQNVPENVGVVSHLKREFALMRAGNVKVEPKSISHVILKIVPSMSLIFVNSNAHNLITQPSMVSTITGCHIRKHQIHAS